MFLEIEKVNLKQLKQDFYFVKKNICGVLIKDVSYFNGIKFDSERIIEVLIEEK